MCVLRTLWLDGRQSNSIPDALHWGPVQGICDVVTLSSWLVGWLDIVLHKAMFQLYSDGTFVHFPLDLLLAPNAMGN